MCAGYCRRPAQSPIVIDRNGVSDAFPDEAMTWLIRVAVSFDIAIVLTGLAVAVIGQPAAGCGIAGIGVGALVALWLLDAKAFLSKPEHRTRQPTQIAPRAECRSVAKRAA